MTLTEFLLARIAEDERDARASGPVWVQEAVVGGREFPHNAAARVLAEAAAKRRIMEMHPRRQVRTSGAVYADGGCAVCAQKDNAWYSDGWTDEEWPCPTLCALASVYADHSDYRQEWAL